MLPLRRNHFRGMRHVIGTREQYASCEGIPVLNLRQISRRRALQPGGKMACLQG